MMQRMPRRAVTIIETVLVILIGVVLLALLGPALGELRENAARSQCAYNLQQLGSALHKYHDVHGHFPTGQFNSIWRETDVPNRKRAGWFHVMLPFVGRDDLYKRAWPFIEAGGQGPFAPGADVPLAMFACPADPNSPRIRTPLLPHSPTTSFHGNYALCAGSDQYFGSESSPDNLQGTQLNGMFFAMSRIGATSIHDGLANTVMASELLVVPNTETVMDWRGHYWNQFNMSSMVSTYWPPNTTHGDTQPSCRDTANTPCTASGNTSTATYVTTNLALYIRSLHAGGANVAFADNSVRFIGNDISPSVFRAAGSRGSRGQLP